MDDVASLLARASSQADQAPTTARHLLARAGRTVAAVLDTPLTPLGPNGNGRVVLAGALDRIRAAHGALVSGSTTTAHAPIETARLAVDLQRPYGALFA